MSPGNALGQPNQGQRDPQCDPYHNDPDDVEDDDGPNYLRDLDHC